MNSHGIKINGLQEKARKLDTQGKSLMYIAYDGRCMGVLCLMDKIKQNA